MSGSVYTDGSYLAKTGGTWHLEDSAFKAEWIARMLAKHPEYHPKTVCEIGCGAGGVLAELEKALPGDLTFTGYEISPQAHAMSERFRNARLNFFLGDAFEDATRYDLVLVIDVVEHVEDCFSFLRRVKQKGALKLYHIPLETYATLVLRGMNQWDTVGHLHLFTIETALKTVEHTGHRIIDWALTDGAVSSPHFFKTRVMNLFRLPFARFTPKLVARLVGGYSMMILAE